MTPVCRIIEALPALNKTELEQVRAAVDELLTNHLPKPDPDLLAAIAKEINTEPRMLTSITKRWWVHAPEAVKFVEDTWPCSKRNRPVRLGLFRLLVFLLADDLKARGASVTLGALATNLGRFPEVFENNYPGWLASNIQDIVVHQMEKN